MELIREMEALCPYCGERIGFLIDCSIASQSYVEDCQVCCQPIAVTVHIEDGQVILLELLQENG